MAIRRPPSQAPSTTATVKRPVTPPAAQANTDADELLDELDPDSDWAAGVGEEGDDDSLVFNLEDVDENAGFEIIPNGIYNFVCTEWDFGRSNAGNPMITLTMEIEAGSPFTGRTLRTYLTFSEKAIGRTKKTIMMLLPNEDLKSFRPASSEGAFLGIRARGQVKVRRYDGEMRSNITRLMEPVENAATDELEI